MILKLENIKAKYPDGFEALKNVNIELKDKSFVVILGESGCGKTTLFKVITGLMDPFEGDVYINDKNVTSLLTESRDISMIFQNYVLYPHMTVYANVIIGLNGFDMSNDEKDLRAKQILKEFGLINYLNFKPRHLSDGQKQRVAMCKALVREPSIFLMDEPLSNLDLPQRVRIKKELRTIFETYDTSFCYITHDVKDAQMLADVVWIMDKGEIIQSGTLKEIKEKPASKKAFELAYGGEINHLHLTVKKGKIQNNTLHLDNKLVDGEYDLCFSYNDLYMSDDGNIEARVYTQKVTPNGLLIVTNIGEEEISFYTDDEEEIELKEGDIIRLQLNKNKLHLF